jgi:hypothetical protein
VLDRLLREEREIVGEGLLPDGCGRDAPSRAPARELARLNALPFRQRRQQLDPVGIERHVAAAVDVDADFCHRPRKPRLGVLEMRLANTGELRLGEPRQGADGGRIGVDLSGRATHAAAESPDRGGLAEAERSAFAAIASIRAARDFGRVSRTDIVTPWS